MPAEEILLSVLRFVIVLVLAGCNGGRAGPSDISPDSSAHVLGGPLSPGTSYFGRSEYIEYIAGNLPVIFTAPHGGALVPGEIPDRTASACGGVATTVRDTNTQELARDVAAAFFERTGKYPHIVINRLHRRKLDANRAELEAACGASAARAAWAEFHAFTDSAKGRARADFGRGWLTDLHGHGHAVARLELGYLLEPEDLRETDATLDGTNAFEDESSLRTFSRQSPLSFSALLRGPTSFGTLLGNAGYRSVPSAQDRAPASGEEYFSGGYITDRHGCARGGDICAVQIESNFGGVRDTPASRAAFAAALVRAYETYLTQFGIRVMP